MHHDFSEGAFRFPLSAPSWAALFGGFHRRMIIASVIFMVCTPAAAQGEKSVAISGIEGQVSFGPTSPLARPGIPNYRPMQARITVLTAEGKVVGQIET